jgi:hypothetical protein
MFRPSPMIDIICMDAVNSSQFNTYPLSPSNNKGIQITDRNSSDTNT